MLYGVTIFVFVMVCIMLMGIILLQSSKTGGMGTAMGGQAINTAFGGHGADKLLVRITSGLAVTFMVLAITIGMMPNPDSRTEYSKEPTISRNKGTVDIEYVPSIELQPIEQSAPAVKAPPLDDSGE